MNEIIRHVDFLLFIIHVNIHIQMCITIVVIPTHNSTSVKIVKIPQKIREVASIITTAQTSGPNGTILE